MNVRGVAFLSRQSMTIAEHGEPAWRTFMQGVTAQDPFFKQSVLPITSIPAEKFIAFNDALIAEFHGGDVQAYWKFGEKSAAWALTQGQAKGFFKPGEYRRFLMSGSAIWSTYFDAGSFKVVPGKGFTDVLVLDVPLPHVYFEYSVLGYLKGGVELLGAHGVRHEALRGFAKGDPDVHYRFWVE